MKRKLLNKIMRMISNKRGSNKEEITMAELREMQRQNMDIVLLDVRSPQEYKEGHLNNSILIPNYELKQKAERLLPNKKVTIVAYCQSGFRSKKTVKILNQLGYEEVYSLKGGING